jgi:hypothetical protein
MERLTYDVQVQWADGRTYPYTEYQSRELADQHFAGFASQKSVRFVRMIRVTRQSGLIVSREPIRWHGLPDIRKADQAEYPTLTKNEFPPQCPVCGSAVDTSSSYDFLASILYECGGMYLYRKPRHYAGSCGLADPENRRRLESLNMERAAESDA